MTTVSKRGTVTERSDLSIRQSKIWKVHWRIALNDYKGVVIGSLVEWDLIVGDGREARWETLFLVIGLLLMVGGKLDFYWSEI